LVGPGAQLKLALDDQYGGAGIDNEATFVSYFNLSLFALSASSEFSLKTSKTEYPQVW
jgi:hypothetical protein